MELARLLNTLQEKKDSLQRAEEDRVKLIGEWSGSPGRVINSSDYQFMQKYLLSLKYIIADYREQISRLEEEVRLGQEKLLKLSQERKLMENLKEKKVKLYREEVAAYLQKESDENALLRLKQD